MFLNLCWKHGERLRMWLNSLKIALAKQDIEQLNILLDEVPKFKNSKEVEEGMFLLKEAFFLVSNLREDTVVAMKQVKQNLDFLNSIEANRAANFDITS